MNEESKYAGMWKGFVAVITLFFMWGFITVSVDPLIAALKAKAPGYVRVVHAPCMGRCHCAPAAAVGKNYVEHAETNMLLKLAKNRAIKPEAPSYVSHGDYVKAQGYETIAALRALREALASMA